MQNKYSPELEALEDLWAVNVAIPVFPDTSNAVLETVNGNLTGVEPVADQYADEPPHLQVEFRFLDSIDTDRDRNYARIKDAMMAMCGRRNPPSIGDVRSALKAELPDGYLCDTVILSAMADLAFAELGEMIAGNKTYRFKTDPERAKTYFRK